MNRTTTYKNINKNLKLVVFTLFTAILFSSFSASGQTLRDRIVSVDYSKQSTRSTTAKKNGDMLYEVKYRLLTMKNYTVFDWLEAKTETNGEVTLRGYVTNEVAKMKAEQLVGEVKGVKKINNLIEVLPSSETDSAMRKSLYRAIYNQNTSLFRYTIESTPPIRIIVKKGGVILLGAVDTQDDSDKAFFAANAVPKVSRVTNKLQTRDELIATVIKPSRIKGR